jgi:hypothetical protein
MYILIRHHTIANIFISRKVISFLITAMYLQSQLPRIIILNYMEFMIRDTLKGGGSGNKLLLGYGFGPWRSMSIKFLMWPSSFLGSTVFPFPVCKARFIGDWLENRRGAPNLLADVNIGASMSPSANRQC